MRSFLIALAVNVIIFNLVDFAAPIIPMPQQQALVLNLVAARPKPPPPPVVAPKPPEPPKPQPPKPKPKPKPKKKPKKKLKKKLQKKPKPPEPPKPEPPKPEPPELKPELKPEPEPEPKPPEPAPAKSDSAPSDNKPTVISAARYRKKTPVRYPSVARRRGLSGTVLLHVLVSTDGKGQKFKVAKSSGHDVLDKAALRSVRNWLFEPNTRNGVPQISWVSFPVEFKLN